MVILTVILFVLSTVDEIQEKAGLPLKIVEIIAVSFFTVEFFLRFWCCIELKEYRRKKYPAWKGKLIITTKQTARVFFLLKPSTIIDILAVFPFWIQLPLPKRFVSVDFLSAIRILRVLLLFKVVPGV
jgi:voltage-gated potassium channel